MSSIKESALKLEKELKNVVQESQRNISNIDERLKSFVEHSTLHKHFGEMKMDLATTESAFKQMTEELKAEMERIRSEYQNLPKLRGLEEQNLDLMRKLKLVEDKMNNDFDKVLAEIQKLGQIFARKAELAAYDGRLNVFEREVNQREQEFNNRIKQRLERLNSQLISVVQDRKGLSREALAELKSSKAMSEQLQAEMGILKEQVIQTQNAIVELNAFIQEQIRA
jgi:peptidoglycan hydrolase CwlO-like protein